jgi:DNA polymerase III subunit alpha
MTYCNLHNHSDGSFDDGYSTVVDIVTRSKELGADTAAITDHGEVNQHLALQKECKKQGLHWVLGMEGYWVDNVAETKATKSKNSHIVLLAENNIGRQNLWALSSLAYTHDYFYTKPLVTLDLLRQYKTGLFASDACYLTNLARAVEADDEATARRIFISLLDVFGDHFYSELHTWQLVDPDTYEKKLMNKVMRDVNQFKVSIATELGVPLVVCNDSHHAWPEEWENKQLKCVYKNSDDYSGQKADHMMGEAELYKWMRLHGISDDVVTQAIANSATIAHSCHAEIEPTLTMPTATGSEAGDTAALARLVEQGLIRRVIDAGLPESPYRQRLDTELRLINDRGFAGYFVWEHDLIDAAVTGRWASTVTLGAQPKPMLVGPGRGSVCGSTLAFVLGITAVDPIKHGLTVDRFMTPTRQDPPDIDTDYPKSRCGDMKNYLIAQHGHDRVCGISTMTRSGAKTALRDAARVLNVSLADVNTISGIIGRAEHRIKQASAGQEKPSWSDVQDIAGDELDGWKQRYPELFDQIGKGVTRIRQQGKHASGVLVADRPLLGLLPTREKAGDGNVMCTFEKDAVAELGGVKMDVLSSIPMDMLTVARELIAQRHGVWLDFRDDRNRPPEHDGCTVITFGDEQLGDPAIWKLIGNGHTTGIFQIHTSLGTKYAARFKPTGIEDLAALVSIVRPGVLRAGLTDEFVARRLGEKPTTYPPLMQPITGDTYGVLIYQEQLLRAARELAGLGLEEAEKLRKQLSKKDRPAINALRDQFISGCLANPAFTDALDDPTTVATQIWKSVEASGAYLFNHAHAVGYAVEAAWQIWVKHYYPVEFIAAALATVELSGKETVLGYIREARRLGVAIAPPDINTSNVDFALDGDALRHGLLCVRDLGPAAAKHIIAARPYTSLADYLARAGDGTAKGVVDNLIMIGAFDDFGDRAELLHQLEYHRVTKGLAESTLADPKQTVIKRKLAKAENRIPIPDFTNPAVVSELEVRLTGSWITTSPIAPYADDIAKWCVNAPAEIDLRTVGARFWVGGELSTTKTITDKNGQAMAFVTLLWGSHEFEVTVFAKEWRRYEPRLVEGRPVICEAQKDDRGGCFMVGLVKSSYFTSKGGQP